MSTALSGRVRIGSELLAALRLKYMRFLTRIYGVMSHVVAGRTREIGLRMTLGAQLSDAQKLIVRQGMWLAAIGSLIGLTLALTGPGCRLLVIDAYSANDFF